MTFLHCILFFSLICSFVHGSQITSNVQDDGLQLMDVFISSSVSSTDSLTIDAVLDAVESSEHPVFATSCSLTTVTTLYVTNHGSFGICNNGFSATLKFFTLYSRQVVLATFEDDEFELYGTNKVLNGNACKEVYNKIGKQCFEKASGLAAQSYVPRWKHANNLTAAVVANYIGTTFSPQVIQYEGVVGRCYPNSGKFKIVGLSAQNAKNALSVRNSQYQGCEITEGDNRWWAGVSWSMYQRFGAIFVGAAALLVALLIPCLSCCL